VQTDQRTAVERMPDGSVWVWHGRDGARRLTRMWYARGAILGQSLQPGPATIERLVGRSELEAAVGEELAREVMGRLGIPTAERTDGRFLERAPA